MSFAISVTGKVLSPGVAKHWKRKRCVQAAGSNPDPLTGLVTHA